jgi:hypothetical protein
MRVRRMIRSMVLQEDVRLVCLLVFEVRIDSFMKVRYFNRHPTIARSIPMAFASCAVIGTLVASFDAAGRSLTGGGQDTASIDTRAERRRRFFKKPPPLEAVSE